MDTLKTGNMDDTFETLEHSEFSADENAIQERREKIAEETKQFSGLVDKYGQSFDASIHKTDESGTPLVGKKGNLVLKPGKKAGSEPKAKSNINIPGAVESTNIPDYQTTGKYAAELLENIGIMLGGDEWRYIKNEKIGVDERAQMENAFASYLRHKNIPDIPPGYLLAFCILGYTATRLTMPKTQTRIGKVKEFFKKKFSKNKPETENE